MTAIELTVIIPTCNERGNIAELVGELRCALSGRTWEAVFVDDSTDGTELVIAACAANDSRVRLLHRVENKGGLAGAVVDGLAHARGAYVCVLDADLQHPPCHMPKLLEAAEACSADIVVASRYIAGGSPRGLNGPFRRLCSRGLKRLTQSMFPRRLRGVSDPLGGYFLLRRSVVEHTELRPIGFKILLEILVRCRWERAVEVPYVFQPRHRDASKAGFRQAVLFLQHLSLLAWDCSPAFAPARQITCSAHPNARVSQESNP